MLKFTIDQSKCDQCGLCVADCPRNIIHLDVGADAFPYIPPEKEEICFDCQHCMAICPHAALSIGGHSPQLSMSIPGHLPDTKALQTLIKGRRSVRQFAQADLNQDFIEHLLEVASHAPTGVNVQQVHFHVIKDRTTMDKFRHRCIEALREVIKQGKLPEKRGYFVDFVRLWDEKGLDLLFHNAPHLVVTSAPAKLPTPQTDAIIALVTFELYAAASGVGTLWGGLGLWAIRDIAPELRSILGIPDDHVIGYVMAFGKPAVKYQRTVQRAKAKIAYVS
ncbi:MAG: nitroreductase family protein [Desulfuromonadaceae bacterium]|nr:nitroreductase family protein [Desulfuromonadaceae bacterium]